MKPFLAFLLLALSPLAKADSVQFLGGPLIIFPDGSTITSIFTIPPGPETEPVSGINFSFPGGTGTAYELLALGQPYGHLTFALPVYNFDFAFLATGFSDSVDSNNGNSFLCFYASGCDTSISFPGLISSIDWAGIDGYGGIDSMSYTVAAPEPSTLLLLIAALSCTIWLGLRRSLQPYQP